MSTIDEFESVFKGAAKARFRFALPELGKVALVSDESKQAAEALRERVAGYLAPLPAATGAEWVVLDGGDYSSLDELLKKLEELAPDLVITSRCLKEEEKNPPYSLGVYLDVLAQATSYPLLVLPNSESPAFETAFEDLREVMVVTDHITGDDRLINWGVFFTPRDGKLVLSHVEDDAEFERYIGLIGKVPAIDTDIAREALRHQILREPQDFIASCTEVLEKAEVPLEVLSDVRLGHLIGDYEQMIAEHEVDLMVVKSKAEAQLAMPGRAYAIVVEFQHLPLLLI